MLIPPGLLQVDIQASKEETRACRITKQHQQCTASQGYTYSRVHPVPAHRQPSSAPVKVAPLRDAGRAGCAACPSVSKQALTCFIYLERERWEPEALQTSRLNRVRKGVQTEQVPLKQTYGNKELIPNYGAKHAKSKPCMNPSLGTSIMQATVPLLTTVLEGQSPSTQEQRGKQQPAACDLGAVHGSRGNGGEHPARPRPSALKCIFSLTCNTVLLSQTMSVFDQFLYPRHRRSERPRPDGSYCRRLPALPLLPSPPPPAR